ncbi:MAG: nuclear transport factor 2 family protein [Gammaproteobacteria bacterium]|nr:nuclear transport factor 2 family protein [Gammaproteobacteria bacterium]
MSEAEFADASGLFEAIDNKDAAGFAAYLTDDASFRFANAPAVKGREAIIEAVSNFFESIAASQHHVAKSIMTSSTLVVEGEVTYTRISGSKLTVPFADVFEFNGSLICDYKIYIDIGQLYTE